MGWPERVEAGDVLLHGHAPLGGVLGKVGQDQLHRLRLVLAQGEEVELPLRFFRRFRARLSRKGS